jgi:O-Antigen ligase
LRGAAPTTGSALLMIVAVLIAVVLVGRLFDRVLNQFHLPAIICSLALATSLWMRGVDSLNNRIGIPLVGLIGWMFLTVPFSSWRGESISIVIYFAFYSLMWLPLALGPRHFKDLYRLIVLLAVLNLITLLLTTTDANGRLQGDGAAYANSEDIALIAIFSIPFWMLIASRIRMFAVKAMVGATSSFFLLLTAARTGSRAALLSSAGLGAVYFFRSNLTKKALFTLIVVLGIPGALFLVPREMVDRLSTIVDVVNDTVPRVAIGDEALDSASARRQMLFDSIRFTFEHPLFGVGPGQFAQFRWDEQHHAGAANLGYLVTHNAYTQISSEEGVPALLFFLAILVGTFRTIRIVQKLNTPDSHRDWRIYQTTALCLQLSFISIVLFGFFLANAQYLFWYLIGGLALALERLTHEAIGARTAAAALAKAPHGPVPRAEFLR